MSAPTFPQFKTLELKDKDIFQKFLKLYKPETSELTFTNLFVWRSHYKFQWSLYKDWLIIVSFEGEVSKPAGGGPCSPS